eukprot:975082-Pyramimonas_sp.AAC.1
MIGGRARAKSATDSDNNGGARHRRLLFAAHTTDVAVFAVHTGALVITAANSNGSSSSFSAPSATERGLRRGASSHQ